jgi:RNA polymerase sigma-70 factor (ECF subfamily)
MGVLAEKQQVYFDAYGKPPDRGCERMNEKASDDDLLQRIDRDRDPAAFEALLERHGASAFQVANLLVSNEADAEEVLQDGMLKVWQSAGRYRGGNARAWIMSIVVNTGLKRIRGRRREVARMKKSEALPARDAELSPAGEVERDEVHGALRTAIEALPYDHRRILAFHYVGGLSQSQIARALSMSKRTVSWRLEQAMGRLRTHLTAAGFAAATPLADRIASALLSETTVSEVLRRKVLARVAASVASGARGTGTPKATTRWLLAAGGLFACAAVALAATLWTPQPTNPTNADNTETVSEKTVKDATPGTPPEGTPPDLIGRWDFNRPGELEGIEIVTGKWRRWATGGTGGSGCMLCEDGCELRLNVTPESLPVRVSWDHAGVNPGGSASWAQRTSWDRHLGSACVQGFTGTLNVEVKRRGGRWLTPWHPNRVIATATFIEAWFGPLRQAVTLVKPEAGARLVIRLKGLQCMDNLEVRRARAEEVPDVSRIRSAVTAVAGGRGKKRRVARVDPKGRKHLIANGKPMTILPGLRGPSGTELWVQFIPAQTRKASTGSDAR